MQPVKIRFFGTRGYVEESSPTHRFHSAFSIETKESLCAVREGKPGGTALRDRPDAIVLSMRIRSRVGTQGSNVDSVYASPAATHHPGFPVETGPMSPGDAGCVAFPAHAPSGRAFGALPCTAVRIEAEGKTLLYSGDVVAFPDPARRSQGRSLRSDGSTLAGSLVRGIRPALIGIPPCAPARLTVKPGRAIPRFAQLRADPTGSELRAGRPRWPLRVPGCVSRSRQTGRIQA
jgi:hypothetical protein